jgi:hypothetical protein
LLCPAAEVAIRRRPAARAAAVIGENSRVLTLVSNAAICGWWLTFKYVMANSVLKLMPKHMVTLVQQR